MESLKLGKYKRRVLVIILFAITLFLLLIINSFCKLSYNGEYENSYFENFSDSVQKVAIFVPHADDEVNIAANLILSLRQNSTEVFVVFFTDFNSVCNLGKKRTIEALESCQFLGVDSNHVSFLGFPEKRQANLSFERSLQEDSAVINAIKTTIRAIQPDLVLCTDFDFNRDHRYFSMLFDSAIGQLGKDSLFNHLHVWKTYAYETAYNAPADFYNLNLKSIPKPAHPQNNLFDTDSPAFTWSTRLRLPSHKSIFTRSVFSNPIYKAFSKHYSVIVYKRALNCINSDIVYWQRRLDNHALHANVSASSGNCCFLNDFKLYDTDQITINYKHDVVFSNCFWSPSVDDKSKTIYYKFATPVNISCVQIYDNPSLEDNVVGIDCIFNKKDTLHFSRIDSKGGISRFVFPTKQNISTLDVMITDYEGRPSISELEIFSDSISSLSPLIKMIDGNTGDFISRCFVLPGQGSFVFDIYHSPYAEKYKLEVLNGSNAVIVKDNCILFNENFDYCKIRVSHVNNPSIYDIVEFKQLSTFDVWLYSMFAYCDKFCLDIVDLYYRNSIVRSCIEGRFWESLKHKLIK